MQLKSTSFSIGALMCCALALGACSGDNDGNNNGGTPKPSDSGVHPDATSGGGTDAGMQGNPDAAGMMPDTGPSGPCPPDWPGCRCTPDPNAVGLEQGSCVDADTVCAPLTDMLAVCLYQCDDDSQCAGKIVGNPQTGSAAPLCRGRDADDPDSRGVCFEQEAQDDQSCRSHKLSGRTMIGCREGATCISLQGDNAGEGTCLQLCQVTPADPTGGCEGALPVCNPNVFSTSSGPIGVCSDRLRGVGERCGGGFTKGCDSAIGDVFCFQNSILDQSGSDPMFPTLANNEGFCVEQCDPELPNCVATSDPGLGAGTCLDLGMTAQGRLGLCSNECKQLDLEISGGGVVPDTCTSTGTFGVGRGCFAFPTLSVDGMFENREPISVCIDVLTPTVAEAQVTAVDQRPRVAMGTTPGDCVGSGMNGEAFGCEDGTACSNVGTQRTPIFGCVRMCTASSTVAAQPYAINECALSASNPGAVCVPFGFSGTATVSIDQWLGFCAPAPN